MHHIPQIIEALASATQRSPHTVGRWLSGDGALYQRLVDGHDITTRRAERIVQAASDRWPEGHPWPMGIDRPEPAPGSPARPEMQTRAAPEDVLAAVRAYLARIKALEEPDGPPPLDELEAVREEMSRAALALGPDGRIACPEALVEMLGDIEPGISPQDYYDATRELRRRGALWRPKRGKRKAVVDALVLAGDARAAA